MSDQSQISISIEKSIKRIGKKNWNKCANHDPLNYNPFVSFEFLNALEAVSYTHLTLPTKA